MSRDSNRHPIDLPYMLLCQHLLWAPLSVDLPFPHQDKVVAVLCDLVARTIIAPNELPIGVITGILGGLLFILLLTRPRSRKPLL